MRKIHWILQNNLIKESDFIEIKSALKADNITYEDVRVIPFSDELPLIDKSDSLKVFYGSTTLIMNAYLDEHFKEGIFYDKEVFSMKNYFDKWGQHMLNYDSSILTFYDILNGNFENTNWFVRPIYDDKSFSGKVMTYEEIVEFESSLKESNNQYLNEDTLVAISKPKTIEKEWRHFIVDKNVISSCRYAAFGELSKSNVDVPDSLISFVHDRCQEYAPNDIFVMDTAIYNGNFKIVECNCFNDTGFYTHGIQLIIREINRHLKRTTHNSGYKTRRDL